MALRHLLALPLLAAGSAHAAGYYIGDVGTRATARGGAFVARPDSVLALHYNPAGLSLLKGAHLEADLNLVQFNPEFKRRCPCADPAHPDAASFDASLRQGFAGRSATNQRGFQDIPFFGAAYGLPFLDLAIGLGAWGPQGARRWSFVVPGEAPGPQRYSAVEVELKEVYYTLGISLSPFEGFRVGGSAQLFEFATKQTLHIWANAARNTTTPEDSSFDIPTTLDVSMGVRPNWSLGFSYDIAAGLSVGGSVLGKRSVRAPGTANIALPDSVKSLAEVTGNQIEIEVNLPPIWRLGVHYELPEIFRAEAAVVVEAWSVYESAIIRAKDISIVASGMAAPLVPITIQYEFQNTYSLRLGGELNLLEPFLGVRAGYFFEPSAVPASRKDASSPDLDKHALSLGLATRWFGVTLELAAQYVLLSELEVTASGQKLVGPLEPPVGSPALLTTVGNGVYSGDYLIVSASLSIATNALLGLDEAK